MRFKGTAMIDRFRDIALALVAVLLLGMAGAAAQTGQSPASPSPDAARHGPALLRLLRPCPAGRSADQHRRNHRTRERATWATTSRRRSRVGNASSIAWKASSKSHACVIRSSTTCAMSCSASVPAIQDFWNRLEPPLAAVKAQVDLLGPGAGRRSTTRARTCCPQPGRAQLSLRAAVRWPGCGPLRQSADRPDHRRASRTFAERTLPATCSGPSPASTRTRLGRRCRTTCLWRRAAFATSWPTGGTVSATGMRSCSLRLKPSCSGSC